MKSTSCMIGFLALAGVSWSQEEPSPWLNRPTALEAKAGWRSLFDGATTKGWRGFGRDAFPTQGWEIENGWIVHRAKGGGGDIITRDTFENFELRFSYEIAEGGNSGVKFRFREAGEKRPIGPEYQILDDEGHRDGGAPKTSDGALYGLFAPRPHPPAGSDLELLRRLKALGYVTGWRAEGHIVARGPILEHWSMRTRLLRADQDSQAWEQAVSASKFAGRKGFGRGAGPIALQDHGDEVRFAGLLIRDYDALPGTPVELFDGKAIRGWRELGDARYVADEESILGEVDGGGQSFLVSERSFGDFLFEVDVKNELPGNSGIQVRSHQRENGRLYGYQIEIDPSDRAWSGGLYDEARRGWLDNLAEDEEARGAFRTGAWNRYRIECVGPSIRAWVNGIPTADHLDTVDLEGFIGLQVHSGNNTRVRWRNLRLYDLGRHRWQELRSLNDFAGWSFHVGDGEWGFRGDAGPEVVFGQDGFVLVPPFGTEDFTLRLSYRAHDARLRLGWAEDPTAVEPERVEPVRLLLPSDEAFTDSYKPDDWNEVSICAYGARTAVILNGKTVLDLRGSRPHEPLFLDAQTGQGSGRVEFRRVEILQDL